MALQRSASLDTTSVGLDSLNVEDNPSKSLPVPDLSSNFSDSTHMYLQNGVTALGRVLSGSKLDGMYLMEFQLILIEWSKETPSNELKEVLGVLVQLLAERIICLELNIMLLYVLIRYGVNLVQYVSIDGTVKLLLHYVFSKLCAFKGITYQSLYLLNEALSKLYDEHTEPFRPVENDMLNLLTTSIVNQLARMKPNMHAMYMRSLVQVYLNHTLDNVRRLPEAMKYLLCDQIVWSNSSANYKVLGCLPLLSKGGDSEQWIVNLCRDHSNIGVLHYLVTEWGILPTYRTMQWLLTQLKCETNYEHYGKLVENVISESVRMGYKMEMLQFNSIDLHANLRKTILTYAREPHWIRFCQTNDKRQCQKDKVPTADILRLASELDINIKGPDMPTHVCFKLKKLNELNDSQITNLYSTKAEAQLQAQTEVFSKLEVHDCFGYNPTSTGPSDVVVYNSPTKTQCYSDESFANILSTKIDPVTGKPLPTDLLKKVKVAQDNIRGTVELVKELRGPDNLSADKSQSYEDTLRGMTGHGTVSQAIHIMCLKYDFLQAYMPTTINGSVLEFYAKAYGELVRLNHYVNVKLD